MLLYGWDSQPITVEEWCNLFKQERHLGDDQVGPYRVSTVWLGLDQSGGIAPRPLIFETMIFGPDDLDEHMWRYSTRDEAAAGHAEVITWLRYHVDLSSSRR